MNKVVKKVLIKLENEGYTAYIVGGYVRDLFLRKNSYDIDICTNALPKEIMKIFSIAKNNSYGGCYFKIGKYNFDITTFRRELKYSNRKPTVIEYINEVEEDIKRRDFTMNTICMDKQRNILDIYNATTDIKKELIVLVGDLELKLQEDPLRILRAIRFATVLNFKLDKDLFDYIRENSSLINTLPKERIRKELNKILLSSNYNYGIKLMDELGVLKILKITNYNIIYSSDILVMYAQLDLSDGYFTKYENNTLKIVKKILNYGKIDNEILFTYGLYKSLVVGEVFNIEKKEIHKIYKDMWINESKPLCISSKDIISTLNIEEGKIVGIIVKELESLILAKKLKNNKKVIIEYLKRRK